MLVILSEQCEDEDQFAANNSTDALYNFIEDMDLSMITQEHTQL